MEYRSTRSAGSFAPSEAILQGLAPDGGLMVPQGGILPEICWQDTVDKDFPGIAREILGGFFPDLAPEVLENAIQKAYVGRFETDEVTPTVALGDGIFISELFRGPTCAFKDVALSILPHLLTAARDKCGVKEEIAVLAATSGDTGKAALEGFRDVPGTRVVVFYPQGGVSRVQRAQMVTQEGNNVSVSAVWGNFDDAQTGVKAIFSRFAGEAVVPGTQCRLSSANSINIGRLAPQLIYYFKSYGDLVRSGVIQKGDPVDFTVPTGNFGNILAGYLARRMGLPVGRLVCASNANDVLTDFIRTGVYDRRRPFYKTDSPSMDILVSSNLERLLFFLSEDSDLVARLMHDLTENGVYHLPREYMPALQEVFSGYRATDEECAASLGDTFRRCGYLADPHTAVALHAAKAYREESGSKHPMVVLATASPYKFSRPVLSALGESTDGDEFGLIEKLNRLSGVPVPPSLAALQSKPERHTDVIEKEGMADYVLVKIGEKK